TPLGSHQPAAGAMMNRAVQARITAPNSTLHHFPTELLLISDCRLQIADCQEAGAAAESGASPQSAICNLQSLLSSVDVDPVLLPHRRVGRGPQKVDQVPEWVLPLLVIPPQAGAEGGHPRAVDPRVDTPVQVDGPPAAAVGAAGQVG